MEASTRCCIASAGFRWFFGCLSGRAWDPPSPCHGATSRAAAPDIRYRGSCLSPPRQAGRPPLQDWRRFPSDDVGCSWVVPPLQGSGHNWIRTRGCASLHPGLSHCSLSGLPTRICRLPSLSVGCCWIGEGRVFVMTAVTFGHCAGTRLLFLENNAKETEHESNHVLTLGLYG